MSRRFLTTDIHGCFYSFQAMVEQQLKLKKADTLYLLGDYINKGPYSKEVLDYLMHLSGAGYRLRMLRGNHEQLLLQVACGKADLEDYQDKGGQTLLKSFSIAHPQELPDKYLTLIDKLDWFFELDDFLLVHAGFDFKAKDPFSPSEEMLNIRDYRVDLEKTGQRIVLHGHSPTDYEQILLSLQRKDSLHYSLDAGCAYQNNPRQAHLLALDLDSWKAYLQPNIDPSDNYHD